MTVFAIGLLLIGLLLSAMFSGTEIGFYRVPKIRLQIEAIAGDRIARRLFWLTNRPSLFVATTLVGNNLANYLCSFGAVLLVEVLMDRSGWYGEMASTLLLTPLLFVYGELMPKYLFMNAPNLFLRRVIPLFLIFVPLFYPISFFLEKLNGLLARWLGQSQQPLLSRLAQKELQKALDEGQAAGLLLPVQRRLARDLFAAGDLPVHRFAEPVTSMPCARLDMNREQVLRLAQRYHLAEILLAREPGGRHLLGYLRVIDLELAGTLLRGRADEASEDSPAQEKNRVRSGSGRWRRALSTPHAAVGSDLLGELAAGRDGTTAAGPAIARSTGRSRRGNDRHPFLRPLAESVLLRRAFALTVGSTISRAFTAANEPERCPRTGFQEVFR